jgi:hypothetical protein
MNALLPAHAAIVVGAGGVAAVPITEASALLSMRPAILLIINAPLDLAAFVS